MSSWSAKRKLTYAILFFSFVIMVVGLPTFLFWYQAPTCFDGKRNGDEVGVDCGGSCRLLCSFEAIEPDILWSRSFKVASGLYSATAYIQNHNFSSAALNAPYVFKVYDKTNTVIATRFGQAYIPKNKIFAIFEPAIQVGEAVPYRTTFEFINEISWEKDDSSLPDLLVREKSLSREDSLPRIDARIQNNSIIPVSNIEIIALVYDGKDNAIGASRTFVDYLNKDQSTDIVFTWPAPFDTQTNICKTPANIMMVIDRSGSMSSDGKDPPQPLTDVKNAAVLFVNQLEGSDKIGVVSYADNSSNPIDSELTSDFKKVKESILSIKIGTDGLQQTNIGDGIEKALLELGSSRYDNVARKIIIMLTDGMPTRPLKAGDEKYPEVYAIKIADEAKKSGIQIYTIGLGDGVNKEYLKNLASTPDYYFDVTSSKNLGSIYKQIATSICTDTPTSIEIIPIVKKGFI
jgi:Mg-chelatase subunit ChlD